MLYGLVEGGSSRVIVMLVTKLRLKLYSVGVGFSMLLTPIVGAMAVFEGSSAYVLGTTIVMLCVEASVT